MNKLWNEKVDFKTRIFMEIVGAIIFGVSLYFFMKLYDLGEVGQYFNMMLCTVGAVIGVEFMVLPFNFNNKYIVYIGCIILGSLLATCYFSEYARTFFVLIILAIVSVILAFVMRKVFSAFVSFAVLSLVVIFSWSLMINYIPQHIAVGVYISIVIGCFIYSLIGVKVNRTILGFLFGKDDEYDDKQLKEHFNFIYMIIFISLNITNWFIGENQEVAAIINNAFITGTLIMNIDWKKMIF